MDKELNKQEIFSMLFDLAVDGEACQYEYYNWALVQALGKPDYETKSESKHEEKELHWNNIKEKAREQLYKMIFGFLF